MIQKYNLNGKILNYSDNSLNVSLQRNKKPDLSLLIGSKSLSKIVKTASKIINIAPKEEDFLYVRVRAVSAGNVIENKDGSAELIPIDNLVENLEKLGDKIRGANDNGDFFSYEELKKNYKTFIGKSAFVDHKNENVEESRGIVLDAIWNDRGKFVELLIAVDRKAFPELCRGVEMGYITDVSMGCKCGVSVCSICGNEALEEDDFCDHILVSKGRKIDNKPVFEINKDIEFFEISFVSQGADKQAKILEKVAHKANISKIELKGNNSKKIEHSLLKIANEKNKRSIGVEKKSFIEDLNNLPWT